MGYLTGAWLFDQVNGLPIDLVSNLLSRRGTDNSREAGPITMVTAAELGWIDKANSHRLARAFQPWAIDCVAKAPPIHTFK
ncbi:hypothetical protein ACVWXL_000688 [Bradyrhizobium sp. GM22.5]